MILEIIAGVLLASAAVTIIEAMIDWASKVIATIAGAILAVLYVIREATRGLFKLYTKTNNNQWLETTRSVSENELPPELRNLSIGNQVEVSKWS